MILDKVKKNIRNKIYKKPSHLIIETTNRCNLNCPYCLVGRQNEPNKGTANAAHNLMTRTVGFMGKKTFEIAHRQLLKFGIKRVYLHFQGEPFLNKHTSYFAKQLKEDGLWVGIFTNGQTFTNRIIDEIVSVEIDFIRFFISANLAKKQKQIQTGCRELKKYLSD
tara:strand:- start:742 stop:1236 length:495 start_codon:yes stop_codon:yes gene_type:complete